MGKYYPNRTGKECFNSSLSNILLLYGEDELAKQVNQRFLKNRLVAATGLTPVVLMPYLVSQLTGGRYGATVRLNEKVLNLFDQEKDQSKNQLFPPVQPSEPDLFSPYSMLFKKWARKRAMNPGECAEFGVWDGVIGQSPLILTLYDGQEGHAVVYSPAEKCMINNGRVECINLDELFSGKRSSILIMEGGAPALYAVTRLYRRKPVPEIFSPSTAFCSLPERVAPAIQARGQHS